MRLRAHLHRKRRGANAYIVRCLTEKRLRVPMILYRSAPQGLTLAAVLLAFLPSSIRSAIAHSHEGPKLLAQSDFYIFFIAKAVAIVAAALFFWERLVKTTKSTDRLLRRKAARAAEVSPY
jgi:hypothetical protein